MSLRRKTEEAVAAVLQAATNLPVYAAGSSGNPVWPCVVVLFRPAEEDPPGTGNTFGSVTIEVQSQVDEEMDPSGADRHENAVSKVEDALRANDLADLLTAARDDFTVMGVVSLETNQSTQDEEGGILVDGWTLNIYAAPKDFDPAVVPGELLSLDFSQAKNSQYLAII